MNLYLWIIPVLPLAGAAINGLLGRRFSKAVVAAVGLVFVGASFLWSLYVASQFGSLPQVPYIETHFPWIAAGDFRADFGFYLDQLSLVMTLVVTGVGFLIHVYSVGYMAEEGGYYRFFSYLNLFMFFMLMLVLANNYLLMFVGWEGVGLASYLLIGFFFLRDSAAAAGKKAFLVNRIGDFGFLLGMFLMAKTFGSLDYAEVFHSLTGMGVETQVGALTATALLLFVGACGKSAQVPLYVWLPDAMEGPTPVSALIHAATMVTAGVYMVARSNPLFSRSPEAMLVVAVIGCFTAIFAATLGMVQTDIKRVLAYSTVSQLGYMFLACGVAAYSAAIFHLMTHAFFKGLLFLAAGSVIHALSGEQDMRRMGGLWKKIPWTFGVMTVATFAIAGIPPLSGFVSKDEILWKAWSSEHGHWVLWAVALLTAFLTSFYMFRLWFMTFFGEYRGEAAEAQPTAAAPSPRPSEQDLRRPLVSVSTPEEFAGAVMSEINSRRGEILKTETPERGRLVVSARLPAEVIADFKKVLGMLTQGRASCSTVSAEAAMRSGDAIVEVATPDEYVPLVARELRKRDGRVESVEHKPGMQIIRAAVPKSKMMYLEADVRDQTNRRATIAISYPVAPTAKPPDAHAHKRHIHESPWVMLAPLVVLAVLSFVGGWVGWPHALWGDNHFEEFLAPVIASTTVAHGQAPNAVPAAPAHGDVLVAERLLTLVSVGAGVLGLFFAWLLYHKRRDLPAKIALQLGGVYEAVRNKYYVDEGYQAVFVQPLIEGSTRLLWRGIDVDAIDRTVDESAEGANEVSDTMRQMQSGNIRSYAGWVAAGAAVVVLYMIWAGVR